MEAHPRVEVHPVSFHFIPYSWQESLTKKQATHGSGLSHYVSKKKKSCKVGSKISALYVVCGNEKLLNFNKNLAKLCCCINNPFKVFT